MGKLQFMIFGIIILSGVIYRLHIWRINKCYKSFFESQNDTEDENLRIIKYIHKMTEIQENNQLEYLMIAILVIVITRIY